MIFSYLDMSATQKANLLLVMVFNDFSEHVLVYCATAYLENLYYIIRYVLIVVLTLEIC